MGIQDLKDLQVTQVAQEVMVQTAKFLITITYIAKKF